MESRPEGGLRSLESTGRVGVVSEAVRLGGRREENDQVWSRGRIDRRSQPHSGHSDIFTIIFSSLSRSPLPFQPISVQGPFRWTRSGAGVRDVRRLPNLPVLGHSARNSAPSEIY